jgi:hypothetical protein
MAGLLRKRAGSGAKLAWTITKWVVGWPLAVFGLAGLPDTILQWSKWIERAISLADRAMSDPRIHQIAVEIAGVAAFLNLWPMRVALFLTGVSIIVWQSPRVWVFRHQIWSFGRRLLVEQIWIDRATALKLVRESDWAKTRDQPRSAWSTLVAGNFNFDKDRIQFNRLIELTLDSFEKRGAYYARDIEGVMKYDEGALRAFLDEAITNETLRRYGDIPK